MSSINRIILLTLIFCSLNVLTAQIKISNNWPIITRKGDQLFEGEKVFRFFGLAAPNIQQNETQIRLDRTNRFPDSYEIRDIYSGIQRMGGRATRTFSLSIFHPDDKNMPVYIPARRTYNEDAFRCLDTLIALAHDYDIRIILPFIASQSFGGIRGIDEFSALAKKSGKLFWTDSELKEDFKHFLNFILNRKNTANRLIYKNDPAILGWQLGNELGSYAGDRKLSYAEFTPLITRWSIEMAAYIKSIDPNHLIIEAGGGDRETFINDPNIDVISDHLYEYWSRLGGGDWQLAPMALRSRNQCKGRKPLIVDEFGLGSYDNIKSLMQTIRENDIVGGLIWSIRSHRRDGGWYYHNEGGTPVNSYHIPGFTSGYVYEERKILDLLREESYKIRGMKLPAIDKPEPAPVLLKHKDGFTWRGSAGAESYTLEKAYNENGPWIVIATGLHDSVLQDVVKFEYSPEAAEPLVLYTDTNIGSGNKFYRIKAVNSAGESDCSQVLKVEGK